MKQIICVILALILVVGIVAPVAAVNDSNVSPGQGGSTTVVDTGSTEGSTGEAPMVRDDDNVINQSEKEPSRGGGGYEIPLPTEPSFFSGQGFIITEDETKAMPIKISLKQENSNSVALTGKMNINSGDRIIELTGKYDGDGAIAFRGRGISFEGQLKEFKYLKILEGNFLMDSYETIDEEDSTTGSTGEAPMVRVDDNGRTLYKLTAFSIFGTSTTVAHRIEKGVEEGVTTQVTGIKAGEVVAVASGDSQEDDSYIQPVQVYRKKIFKIFPWGKKVVEVRVIKEGEIETYEIEEGAEKTINGYKVSAKNFEGEEVELEIIKE